MKRIVLSLVLCLLLVPTIANADKTFSRGKGATWDCKQDPSVYINHGKATYTFKGECKTIGLNGGHDKLTIESVDELDVNGGDNTVIVGTVDTINVNGSNNTITWKKAKSGDAPKTNSLGKANKIEQAK